MKTHSLLISFALLTSINISAFDSQYHNTQALIIPHVTRDLKIKAVIQSFFTLVKVFIAIITHDEFVTRVKAIEELITSIVQTALYITDYASPQTNPGTIAQALVSNEKIKRTLIGGIISNSGSLYFEPMTRSLETFNEAQNVNTHFSTILQSFFNIMRDPENPPVTNANLKTMLAHIITVGQEINKRGAINSNSALQEIARFVTTQVDIQFKKEVLSTFDITIHRNGVKEYIE